jgi:hypothetical protein
MSPFPCAESAWLWFWQCQTLREAGARFVADAGGTARPCDPDDVYRVAATLYRRHILTRRHMQVLATFGRRLVPPDGRLAEEAAAARDWQAALDHMDPYLAAKGIVPPPRRETARGAQAASGRAP